MDLTDEMLKELGFDYYKNKLEGKVWILQNNFFDTDKLKLYECNDNFPKTLKELGIVLQGFYEKKYTKEGERLAKFEIGKTLRSIVDYGNGTIFR